MFSARAFVVFLASSLASAPAFADDAPFRAPRASVSLSAGAAWRNSGLQKDPTTSVTYGQTVNSSYQGFSPTLLRLRADYFFINWLGVEVDATGDFFVNKEQQRKDANGVALPLVTDGGVPEQGFDARLAVTARYVHESGFVLSGSLGAAVSASPVVLFKDPQSPVGSSLFSIGPALRVGAGYTHGPLDANLSVAAMYRTNAKQLSFLEPRVFIGWRFLELDTTALTAGLDVSAHLEDGSPSTGTSPQYRGVAVRTALGVTLSFLPPKPPAVLRETSLGTTAVRVQVHLPDGSPALGATVALDKTTAVSVDGKGEFVVPSKPGAHTARASLAGYRAANATTQLPEGLETLLVIRLEALTGPGRLSGVVRAAATSKPVADAVVTAAEGQSMRTGPDGAFNFAAVGPGPVQVKVEAQGFNTVQEVAQVPPEGAATLDVSLEALGKGSPATVRGLVRSRTGEALTATVVIKGLSTRVPVNAEGRFVITIPGGQYLFTISAPGYVSQTKKVVLADGDQAIFHTELQKVGK